MTKSKSNGKYRVEEFSRHLFLFLLIGPFASFSTLELQAQSKFQQLTPSFLLDSGVFEGKLFGQLYTQTAAFDEEGQRVPLTKRSSFFTGIGQFLFGIHPRVNIGIESWGHATKVEDAESPYLDLFQAGDGSGRRSALSYLGPRIKFAPHRDWTRTSLELAFLFPIAPDLEGRKRDDPFLAADRYSLILKGFYDKELTQELRLFVRVMPWLSLDREFRRGSSYLSSPIIAFISYIPTSSLTFYAQSEWWPTYGSDAFISSSFFQQGLGIKYMIIEDRLEVEMLYSRFLFGRNTGAGHSLGIGTRFLLGE